jgi:outer membrane murein-binding lipoprotein Lpp
MPPEQVSLNTLYDKISEATIKASEAKHVAAGASQKIDAVAGKVDTVAGKVDQLALVVATQGQLRDHVERLEQDLRADHAEIEVLKADKYRRQGAIGVAEAIRRFWPLIPFAAILAIFIAWANGRIG